MGRCRVDCGIEARSDAQRNPNHHKGILALSTAFWDTCLKNDQAAVKWLKGDKAKSVLETKDKWELK